MAGGNFFARLKATDRRVARRSCESLLGICAGLLADHELNEKEVFFLDQWLLENDIIAEVWPGSEVTRRVREALKDGVLTKDELENLKIALVSVIGGTLEDTGSASAATPTQILPFDLECAIGFQTKSFCLTGQFLYGPREKCVDVTVTRGGKVLSGVRRDLDYLVVGTLVSAEWKHSRFGNKIEKAIEYREKGLPLVIISEERWTHAL